MVKAKLAKTIPNLSLLALVTTPVAFFLTLVNYLPNIGFLNSRDGLISMEYAKYQLSNGLALDGLWSYTLNSFHPTPFYHLILVLGGAMGDTLVGNFDTGALALMITFEVTLLCYSLWLFAKHFTYRRTFFIALGLASLVIMTPLRKDLYLFAEPQLNSIYIILNFITISIVAAWLLAMHLIWSRNIKSRFIPIFILSALFTGYLPLTLAGILFFALYFLKDFLCVAMVNPKREVSGKVSSKKTLKITIVPLKNAKDFYLALLGALLPYSLIIFKILKNGYASLLPESRMTNASGVTTTFSLFNDAIKFHLYGLSPFIYYGFLLLLALIIIIFIIGYFIRTQTTLNLYFIKSLLWILLSNLALLAFIYVTHPSPLTLYISTFLSFVALFSLLAFLFLLIENTPNLLRRGLTILLVGVIALSTVMHLQRGGLEIALQNDSDNIFAYYPVEIKEFKNYLESNDISRNIPYQFYYNHEDYNLTMIAPVLLKWFTVLGYNICIKDERSLPSFNCGYKKVERQALELVTEPNGFKSKHLDVFNPVVIKKLDIKEVKKRYGNLWLGSWPTIKDVEIFK